MFNTEVAQSARSTARMVQGLTREAAKRNVVPFREVGEMDCSKKYRRWLVIDRGGPARRVGHECWGGFRKRGNSLEGFHAGTRPRATAQSIELSISRLGGSSDKVTHPLVPHLPFVSPPSHPLSSFSSVPPLQHFVFNHSTFVCSNDLNRFSDR